MGAGRSFVFDDPVRIDGYSATPSTGAGSPPLGGSGDPFGDPLGGFTPLIGTLVIQ